MVPTKEDKISTSKRKENKKNKKRKEKYGSYASFFPTSFIDCIGQFGG